MPSRAFCPAPLLLGALLGLLTCGEPSPAEHQPQPSPKQEAIVAPTVTTNQQEKAVIRSLVFRTAADTGDDLGFTLTPEAVDFIATDFAEHANMLERAADLHRLNEAARVIFISRIIESYLSELRDSTLRMATVGATARSAAGFRIAGAGPREPVEPPVESVVGSASVVASSSVQRFSPSAFLESIPLNTPTGRLVIRSRPTEADIWIDGAERGTTNKTFVASPGQYRVQVAKTQARLRCTQTVSVLAHHDAEVCCPAELCNE